MTIHPLFIEYIFNVVASGVTFVWPSTRKVIKLEFYLATMSIICRVLINGSKKYTGK